MEEPEEEDKKADDAEEEFNGLAHDYSDYYSEQSFDAADFEENTVNEVHWSNIEEANDKGCSRKFFKK